MCQAGAGAGAGLDEEGVRRKAQAVREGLAVNAKLLLTGPKVRAPLTPF